MPDKPSRDPIDWVTHSQHVRAFYTGPTSGTRAMGRVIAYSDRPQVLIETADGDKVWWQAHLCEPVPVDHLRSHDHTDCTTCGQIYRDGYRTGYMHAGGDTTKLPHHEGQS